MLDDQLCQAPELIEFCDTDRIEHVAAEPEPEAELPDDVEVADDSHLSCL